MTFYPSRPLSHQLENRSDLFLRNQLPPGWIIDKPTDYGIDYKIDIVQDGAVIGHNFSVQLKAHETVAKGKPVTVQIERSTINFYLNRLEPILLICFVADRTEAYYKWFTDSTVDLTKNNAGFTIRLDENNRLSTADWNQIAADVNAIFSRKFMLNTLPEIDFSGMGDESEKTASAYYVSGEYEIAEQLFKKLNVKKPNGAWLNSIAMCQYALFRYKEALATINKAIANHNLPEFWVNKACILAEYGIETSNPAMLKEASALFQQASQEHGDAHYFYNYANTASHLGDFQTAELNYKKCLKLNPNYAKAWKNLGQLYSGRNKQKKELECYNNALAIDPKLPQALFSKGLFLVKEEKKIAEGLVFMEEAVKVEPDLFLNYDGGYFWFAYSHFQLGDVTKGLDYLQQGLDQYPGNPYLLNLKRQYFQDHWESNENIRAEAKAFFAYRLDLSPDDMLSLELLCRIYLAEDKPEAAFGAIKQRTALFGKSAIDLLVAENLELGDYLSGLYSHAEYAQFRLQYSLATEINIGISTPLYIELTELIGLKIFHEALLYCKKHRNDKNFEWSLLKMMTDLAATYYPRTAVYFIRASVDDVDLFGYQVSELITGLPVMAIKEVAKINAYLSVNLKLNNDKMNAAIKKIDEKTIHQRILEEGLDRVQARYHFWPDN